MPDPIIISTINDAYISGDETGYQGGMDGSLLVGQGYYRALLEFVIDPDMECSAAVLRLTVINCEQDSGLPLVAALIPEDWSEEFVCVDGRFEETSIPGYYWPNPFTPTDSNLACGLTAGILAYGQVAWPPTAGGIFDLDIDILPAIEYMRANSLAHMRLMLFHANEVDSSSAMEFLSREHDGGSAAPRLILTPVPTRGYRVYLRPGDAPEPGVDTPAVTTEPGDDLVEIDAAAEGLMPNAYYHGAVTAFSPAGESAPARFEFQTDDNGLPDMSPARVSGLRATAIAGGRVRVQWHYRESDARATGADSFEMTATPEAGGDPVVVTIPATPPLTDYTAVIELTSGTWVVAVVSLRGGAGRRDGAAAIVVADADPPAAVTAEVTVS